MIGSQCEAYGGQCDCQPGVVGRACDSCDNGFYGFSSAGCQRKKIAKLTLLVPSSPLRIMPFARLTQ